MNEVLISTTNFSIFLDLDEVNLEEAFICLKEQYGWSLDGSPSDRKVKA